MLPIPTAAPRRKGSQSYTTYPFDGGRVYLEHTRDGGADVRFTNRIAAVLPGPERELARKLGREWQEAFGGKLDEDGCGVWFPYETE